MVHGVQVSAKEEHCWTERNVIVLGVRLIIFFQFDSYLPVSELSKLVS